MQHGLQIVGAGRVESLQQRVLATLNPEVRQGDSDAVVWDAQNVNTTQQNISSNSLWLLEPHKKGQEEDGFKIRMPYGDRMPQLVASATGKLLATTSEADGFDDGTKSLWRIRLASLS